MHFTIATVTHGADTACAGLLADATGRGLLAMTAGRGLAAGATAVEKQTSFGRVWPSSQTQGGNRHQLQTLQTLHFDTPLFGRWSTSISSIGRLQIGHFGSSSFDLATHRHQIFRQRYSGPETFS
jgi:hypothetical protein